MPAGTVAFCRERLIRLKPGLRFHDVRSTNSTFISRWDACRDSGILPGTPDPAEAGTPIPRCSEYKFNVH